MPKIAHYFIAIPLPTSVQNYFSVWQEELKEKLNYKQWPYRQDLHITLKFLGPVDDNESVQLHHVLQNIITFEAFTIDVGSIGTFGKTEMPRVLWAGVHKSTVLDQFQQQIEELLVHVGFQRETRSYHPHITLAKKWCGGDAGVLLENLKNNYTEQQKIVVDTICLYRIHPTSKPKYEPVHTYRLQGGE